MITIACSGAPGEAAQSIQLNPYIVAFHSQKNVAPKCFDGMTELWTGYSFMFVDGKYRNNECLLHLKLQNLVYQHRLLGSHVLWLICFHVFQFVQSGSVFHWRQSLLRETTKFCSSVDQHFGCFLACLLISFVFSSQKEGKKLVELMILKNFWDPYTSLTMRQILNRLGANSLISQ